jgi:hypothetical protein
MVYPYWNNNKMLKNILLNNKIYTATYWPNIKEWCAEKSIEMQLLNEVVYLPIDQRYGHIEMKKIINLIV